jgi:hypothetical protein
MALKKKCPLFRYSSIGNFGLEIGDTKMSKREIIDFICQINKSAKPDFLAHFSVSELSKYLDNLMEADTREMQLIEA